MSTSALLSELVRRGVRLAVVDGDRLSVRITAGRLPNELRARLVESRQELVDLLRQAGSGPVEDVLPQVVPAGREDEPFPLSDLQMSFIVGMRDDMEYAVRPHFYCETDHASLDPRRFEDAINLVLARQRANIVTVSPDLRLSPVADPCVTVVVHDLRDLPETAVSTVRSAIRERLAHESLPVDRWPWLRWEISLYDGGARLHANLSNFFSDGFGMTSFMAAVWHHYNHPGEQPTELEIGFRDCVLALQDLENSPRGERSRRYWDERLPGLPDAPPLPVLPGGSALSRRELVVPADRWQVFQRNAGACGITPSNAVYAVYAEVLARWSGSRHFLLNAMMSHRFPMHDQIGEVLGNFASLYPLEVDWRGEHPFRERANRLQDRVMTDLMHSYCGSTGVLESLNRIKGTPGRAACPFVVASGLFMGPQDEYAFSRLETPQALLDHQFFERRDGSLWLVWDVAEAAFPPGFVDALCDAHARLFDLLTDDPLAWDHAEFDLLPQEQLEPRIAPNRSAGEPCEGRLGDVLTQRALSTPDETAVVCGAERLTWAQLRDRATALAGELPVGRLVAVRLPKSCAQIVAVHAVLLARSAYVPVEPGWPLARVELVLEDTGAAAVITDAGVERRATSHADASELAYVIYTSGSTGRPKGVALGHRGPLNTILDVNERFGITASDVVFGVSSLCFDLSVYDTFSGRTLVLPGADESTPSAWLASMREHRVTVWNSAPALMELLADAAETADVTLPDLRVVLLSGDWIPLTLPGRVRAIAPNAEVISLGGATEASIWSIHHRIGEVPREWTSIPYGTPLAHQTWHVLDPDGRDVPTWTTGELYIGGPGVALGYWRDKARTGKAFVHHRGERLYRTGDLGRYHPDGTIELLGRRDAQLKIQGFRVEPGEVEHALLTHDRVRAAAVVGDDGPAGKQLVAFVVGDAEPAALEAHVAGRLPAHLVPGRVVVVEELPITANGKLDRAALAVPRDPARASTAPRTPLEADLVEIWKSVLPVGDIGVHDDFFELGGTSFAALVVITRIDQRLGHRLTMGSLLRGRTVARLAKLIEAPAEESPLVVLSSEDGEDAAEVVLVHPAGGGVLCYRELAAELDGRCLGLQATAPIGTVREAAARYLKEVGRPRVLGGWSSGGAIAFEMAAQLERAGSPVDRVVMIDAPAPLDHEPVDEASLAVWFLEDLGVEVPPAAREPAAASADPLAAVLRDVPDADSLRVLYPVFASIVRATRAYRPEPIAADIRVVRARDGVVSEFEAHPAAAEADWGWSAFTTGAVTAREVPSTHHTILSHVRTVAAEFGGVR